jgi:hypothetical protein
VSRISCLRVTALGTKPAVAVEILTNPRQDAAPNQKLYPSISRRTPDQLAPTIYARCRVRFGEVTEVRTSMPEGRSGLEYGERSGGEEWVRLFFSCCSCVGWDHLARVRFLTSWASTEPSKSPFPSTSSLPSARSSPQPPSLSFRAHPFSPLSCQIMMSF